MISIHSLNVENQYCRYYSLFINLHIFLERTLCCMLCIAAFIKYGRAHIQHRAFYGQLMDWAWLTKPNLINQSLAAQPLTPGGT